MSTNSLTKTLGVEIKTEITKDDLIAVQVSKIEETLISNRSSIEKDIKELSDKVETNNKEIKKLSKEICEKDADTKLKNIHIAAEGIIGSKYEQNIEVSVNSCLPKNHELLSQKDHFIGYDTECNITKKSGKKTVEDESLSIKYSVKLPVPKEVVELIKQNNKLSEQITEKEQTLYKVRSALSNMSRFERQAKAKVAQKLIEASGAEFNIDEEFKIPGIPELKFLN